MFWFMLGIMIFNPAYLLTKNILTCSRSYVQINQRISCRQLLSISSLHQIRAISVPESEDVAYNFTILTFGKRAVTTDLDGSTHD